MDRWHIPFHVIEREWTDDQFFKMVDKMGERLKREHEATKKHSKSRDSGGAGGSNVRTRTLNLGEAQKIGTQERGS
jgi:hypothetical protein